MARTKCRRVRAVIVAFAVLAAAAYGLWSSRTPELGAGSAGARAQQKAWDPTGSHPLPNESVERAP